MIYVIDSYVCTQQDEEFSAYVQLSGTLAVDRSVAEVQVRYNGDIYGLSYGWAEWNYSGSNPESITARIYYDPNMYFMFYDGDEIELIQNVTDPGPSTTVVTFNTNGGSGGPGTATYTYGHVGDDYYVGDFIPTNPGYTFLGWYDAQTGGEQVWDENGIFNGGSYGEATGDPSHDEWGYSGSTLTVWAHWQNSSSGNTLFAHPNGGTISDTSTVWKRCWYDDDDVSLSFGVYNNTIYRWINQNTAYAWTGSGFSTTPTTLSHSSGTRSYTPPAGYTALGHDDNTSYYYFTVNSGTYTGVWCGTSYSNESGSRDHTGLYRATVNGWTITSGVATKTVHLGDPYSSCGYWPIPTRSGYSFIGWYDLASGGNQFTDSDGEISDYSIPVTDYYDITDGHWLGYGNLSLHAHWESSNTVDLELRVGTNGDLTDTSGGTTSGSGTYTSGSSVTATAIPNPGYRFTEWVYGGSISNLNPYTFVLNSHTVLYAVFESEPSGTYTINFNQNSGTGPLTTVTVRLGESDWNDIRSSLPSRTGYTFAGYYDALSGGNRIWHSDGACDSGSGGLGVFNSHGTYWEMTSTPPFGTNKRLTWYYSGSTNPITAYARWTENTGTLTYDWDDGTTETETLYYSQVKTAKAPPTYSTSYDTLGWADTLAGAHVGTVDYHEGDVIKPANEIYDKTVYCVWRSTLRYDSNPGITILRYMYYGSVTTADPAFTKTGHRFIGWCTQSSGTGGTWYQPGDQIKAADSWQAHLTLYARWELKTYHLTLYTNDSKGTVQHLEVTYTSDTNHIVSLPVRLDNTFLGYYDENDVEVYSNNNGTVTSVSDTGYWSFDQTWQWTYDGDVTLYGHWIDGRHKYIYNDHKEKIEYAHGPDTEIVWETNISPDFPE